MKLRKPRQDHYKVLGVSKDSTPADIKRAYRRKAKSSHPDKGGNPEDMSALATAYSVLSDPDRRQRYDDLGDDKPPNSIDQDVRGCVIEAFNSCIQSITIGSEVSVLTAATDYLRGALRNQEAELRKGEQAVKHLTRKRARVTSTGENYFHMLIDNMVSQVESQMQVAEHKKKVITLAMEKLKEYKEEVEQGRMPASIWLGSGSTGEPFGRWP